MGKTVKVASKMKDVIMLKETLKKIFGWKNFETVDPVSEKKGKKLNANLAGGGGENAVLVVRKKDLWDKQGRKAVWSDFAVVRVPDGTLEIRVDLHNFDMKDKIPFVTPEMIGEVKGTYSKQYADKKFATAKPVTISNWKKVGSKHLKIIEVDEEFIPGFKKEEKNIGMQLL